MILNFDGKVTKFRIAQAAKNKEVVLILRYSRFAFVAEAVFSV